MAAMAENNENARPAEAEPKVPAGYRIGANGIILGPDGKPCKVMTRQLFLIVWCTDGSHRPAIRLEHSAR